MAKKFNFYHPHMWVGNVSGHVCLSVCLFVCLSVYLSACPSVQTITFELFDKETSFLVCRYILTISRSSLSIKVIGSRSRSYEKNSPIRHLGGSYKMSNKMSIIELY